MTEYDKLARIYDIWSSADPAANNTVRFYTDIGSEADGPILYLGVGNGRIAVELAKLRKKIIGVDISVEMLRNCARKARAAGVAEHLQLIQADIRKFALDERVNLAIFPFRAFGHLLTSESKLEGLKNIYRHLAPGGRLIFDHYVFDEAWARDHNGVSRLMVKTPSEQAGYQVFVWDTYLYDFDRQFMDCLITLEEVDHEGLVMERQHCPLSFSWVEPENVRSMLSEIGFEVESLYGSFDRAPFTPEAHEQIWVARRPQK